MYCEYPNETILPILWVATWVKYLSNINNYNICKSRYGLHLIEWPVNPNLRQEWQEKLRRVLKLLWKKDVKNGVISSAYLQKINSNRRKIQKQDNYAWGVCCLIYSNIDKVTSWLEVPLYWNKPKVTGYKGNNLFIQLDDLLEKELCTCSHYITKGNEIFSSGIHNKHACETDKTILPIYRSLILGNDCIKKNSLVPKVIQVAELLNVMDKTKLDDFKKIHDERSAPAKYINNLKEIVDALKKCLEKANKEDDLELKEKIEKIDHFNDIITKAEDHIEWLNDVEIREKDRGKDKDKKNKTDRTIEKIVSDTTMENIKKKLSETEYLKNVDKETKSKLDRKFKEKVLLTPIIELTEQIISTEIIDSRNHEKIVKLGNIMLERPDELYNIGLFNCSDVEKWDEKIQKTTNDCLDRYKEHINEKITSLTQEESNKLTKRPGSNQCKGKYCDGETTWGDIYFDDYRWLKYCVNKNYFDHLPYDINSWFHDLGMLELKKEDMVKIIKNIG